MIATERLRKLMNDSTISEEKAEEIRAGFRNLAEIIFEKWNEEKNNKKAEKTCRN